MAIAELSGRAAVEMVEAGLTPSRILTREAFENAITVVMALGGSTNAVVHLIAIAGRVGIHLTWTISTGSRARRRVWRTSSRRASI